MLRGIRTKRYRPTKPDSTTTTIDQYAADTMPLNLNAVWNVTSTGPKMPQNTWTSSQVLRLPASRNRRTFLRTE
ncbi:MAG: hypothetical protein DMF94_27140 [Acidobacteria bacterium]|nr:MAG: hypothetical protein DMF94_27140 [Acidobacteriota bacterium]